MGRRSAWCHRGRVKGWGSGYLGGSWRVHDPQAVQGMFGVGGRADEEEGSRGQRALGRQGQKTRTLCCRLADPLLLLVVVLWWCARWRHGGEVREESRGRVGGCCGVVVLLPAVRHAGRSDCGRCVVRSW